MSIDTEIAAVCVYAKRLGVIVELGPREIMRGFLAPMHRGAIVKPGLIHWDDFDDLAPIGLLHDVHHAWLWGKTGNDPSEQNELGAMLWLDWSGVRKLRLRGWSKWMRDFGVSPTVDWGDLSSRGRHELLLSARADYKALS